MGGQDRNGLQLENIGPSFSISAIVSWKNHPIYLKVFPLVVLGTFWL